MYKNQYILCTKIFIKVLFIIEGQRQPRGPKCTITASDIYCYKVKHHKLRTPTSPHIIDGQSSLGKQQYVISHDLQVGWQFLCLFQLWLLCGDIPLMGQLGQQVQGNSRSHLLVGAGSQWNNLVLLEARPASLLGAAGKHSLKPLKDLATVLTNHFHHTHWSKQVMREREIG